MFMLQSLRLLLFRKLPAMETRISQLEWRVRMLERGSRITREKPPVFDGPFARHEAECESGEAKKGGTAE